MEEELKKICQKHNLTVTRENVYSDMDRQFIYYSFKFKFQDSIVSFEIIDLYVNIGALKVLDNFLDTFEIDTKSMTIKNTHYQLDEIDEEGVTLVNENDIFHYSIKELMFKLHK